MPLGCPVLVIIQQIDCCLARLPILAFAFASPVLLCGTQEFTYCSTPCWAMRNWDHSETHPFSSENDSSHHLGHGNPMLSKAPLLYTVISPQGTTQKVRWRSCVHLTPINLSGVLQSHLPQDLTCLRTGPLPSSGIIHTEASKCAPITPWCFLLHGI